MVNEISPIAIFACVNNLSKRIVLFLFCYPLFHFVNNIYSVLIEILLGKIFLKNTITLVPI